MTRKTLLAVDGNSLVHRSFHALVATNLHTRDGRPTWAVKGFCSQVLGALDRVSADALIVGFDDHGNSSRKARWPHYKATRKPKPPELGQQIALTAQFLRDTGVHVVVPDGLEADDVLASAARRASDAGWHTIILTSDRDSFALINETTSVLRLINGGVAASPILTPDRLVTLTGVRPEQYREYAAMRGDSSDNLEGMLGIGEKTAAKLLAEFGTVEAAFADVDSDLGRVAGTRGLGRAVAAKLSTPENRAAFDQNVAIMTMHTDLELDGFNLNAGVASLPLNEHEVRGALDGLELASLHAYALRVLAGVGVPVAQPAAEPPWPGMDIPFQVPDEVPAGVDEHAGYLPPDPATQPQYTQPGTPQGMPERLAPAAHVASPVSPPRPEPALQPALATVGAMTGSTAPRPSSWAETLF